MRAGVIVAALISLSTMGSPARAQGNYMLMVGPSSSDPEDSNDSRAKTSHRHSHMVAWTPQSHRLVLIGALVLGINWTMCTAVGLILMSGDPANAQMAIPFFATSGWAVKNFEDSAAVGAILLLPTLIQSVGAILILCGLVKRRRARQLIEVGAAPVVFPHRGAGVGITLSL